MKLLSIAIPCYNSQDYMENCIESLLVGGEEVEILIVDDGSSDRTAEIADDYARKYPTIVKAIHQDKELIFVSKEQSGKQYAIPSAFGAYAKYIKEETTR